MDILTIASQKGGVGKTTLSAHLAVEAERAGHGPVAVVDTDPQGSLADWWNQRAAETPIFASVEVVRLAGHMAELRQQQVNLVVITTPPAFLQTIRAAILVADLVLIPARPSPHDLRAVGVVVEMAEHAQKGFCFVVNGATPRSTIALEAVQALAQHGLVAPVIVHQRIDFAGSMVDGRRDDPAVTLGRRNHAVMEICTYANTQTGKESIGWQAGKRPRWTGGSLPARARQHPRR